LQAPGARLLPQVREAVERPALEEALAHVRDAPLHVRLVLRVSRARRIGQEAAVLAVLQEAPRQPRRERVGPGHRRREVVQHQRPRHAAEERPGRLEAGDHLLQRLPEQRPDEGVARVGQDDHQRPHHALPPRLRVQGPPEPAEVRLGARPGLRPRHPHRGRGRLPEAVARHEPAERAVRDGAAPALQQLQHPRQLQPLAHQPALDLPRPPRQRRLARRLRLPRPRPLQGQQRHQLRLGRRRPAAPQPETLGGGHVLAHRHARQPGLARQRALARAALPPAQHFLYFHSSNLPICHRRSPRRYPAMVAHHPPEWINAPDEPVYSPWRSGHPSGLFTPTNDKHPPPIGPPCPNRTSTLHGPPPQPTRPNVPGAGPPAAPPAWPRPPEPAIGIGPCPTLVSSSPATTPHAGWRTPSRACWPRPSPTGTSGWWTTVPSTTPRRSPRATPASR